jgi:hypothetical protein
MFAQFFKAGGTIRDFEKPAPFQRKRIGSGLAGVLPE